MVGMVYHVGVQIRSSGPLTAVPESALRNHITIRVSDQMLSSITELAADFDHSVGWGVRHLLRIGLRQSGYWMSPAEIAEDEVLARNGGGHG